MTPFLPHVAKMSASCRPKRSGVTALEYTFVGFLLLILVALISMGLLRARESARDQLCLRRLVLLATAVNEYELQEGGYPGYTNPSKTSQTQAISWVAATLPYLDERLPLIEATSEGWKIREKKPANAAEPPKRPWQDWKKALAQPIAQLMCPNEDAARLGHSGATSYIASCGYPDAPADQPRPDYPANGIFLDLRKLPPLTEKTVQEFDGTEFTLLLSENVQSGSWDSLKEAETGFVWTEALTNASALEKTSIPEILAINQGLTEKPSAYRTARPSSRHVGSVHAVFANTRLSKIRSDIDPIVYIRLCTVDDTGLVNPWTQANIGPPIGREPQ